MAKIVEIFINKLEKEEVKFMKKLLLLSLLIMGVESFASVTGNDTKAEMPIVVKGTVLAKSGTNLVIVPTTHASDDGNSIELNFGETTKGGDARTLGGGFTISREVTSTVINANTAKIAVGLLNSDGTDVRTSAFVNSLGGLSGVSASYTASSTVNREKTKVTGTVSVALVVAETAPTGEFSDNSQKIGIIIKP